MATKPIDKYKVESILIDWRMGRMSMSQIAGKYEVSKSTVGKICKDIAQDGASTVDDGIKYRQALQAHDGRMADAIEREVDTITKWIDWLHRGMIQNAQEAMSARCDNQDDFLKRTNTLSKTKDGIVGKSPETQVNVQSNVITRIERVIVRPGEATAANLK